MHALLAAAGSVGAAVIAPTHAAPGTVPPQLALSGVLTTWSFEPLPALLVAATAVLYLMGTRKLAIRGDRWSPGRTTSFLLGLIVIALATESFVAAYDTVLLSVHMAQHMMLAMLAPILLALGAPVTLALRTLPPAGRGLLLRVLHFKLAGFVTFPLVAGVIYIVNPWLLYFTPLYEATLRNPMLHNINHLHLLLVGCLWFWVLLGIDPLPHRSSYPMRLLAVFLTLPFHAFLGIAIMGSTRLLAEDWYTSLGRVWGASPLEDQQLAGAMLWASGDLVGILMFVVLSIQWSRQSEREARAVDRRLDREEEQRARARAASLARDHE